MINPEDKECIELFCKTIAELNAVSLKQMEGYLNLAVTAVESLGSAGGANDAKQFVAELKTTAEAIASKAQEKQAELFESLQESVSVKAPASFCKTVEERLNTALENSLANQQQLNVTGNAILAQAASIVLSSAGERNQ
jgi:hypothetical protein